VLGQLPLAAPVSGFVLGFDKATGQFIPLNENLGSVLTERGNTVGKHKVFLGFTAQRFVFHAIDGINLSNLPSAFQLPSVYQCASSGTAAPPQCPNGPIISVTNIYGASVNFMTANMNQYTGIIAFGLTDRIDISLTVPFERVSLSAGNRDYTNALLTYNSSGVLQSAGVCSPQPCYPPGAPATNFVGGSASGFGDILVNMKGTVVAGEKNKLALGLEARFPTGNEYNLLGTGAFGVKPYVVFSRLGRVTPHVNLGYQWNDYSNLYINNCYFAGTCSSASSSALPTLQLPHSLDYSVGVDIGLVKKLTVVGDYVGQHYFNAPEVTPAVTAGGTVPGLPNCTATSPPAACTYPGFPQFASSKTVGVTTGSINVDNVALGLKVNPVGRLILSANALIRLDTGGLRPDRFVPLIGISYRF
jgi:hypothetical protein